MRCTGPCYATENGDKTIATYKDEEKGLKPILASMGKAKYICGDELTWVDFVMFEFLQLLRMVTKDKIFEEYPVLKTYHETMKQVEGLQQYIEDEDCPIPNMIFNNKHAKVNGTLGF